MLYCPIPVKGFFLLRVLGRSGVPDAEADPSKQGGRGIPQDTDIKGGAVMRVKVTLRCNECKQRNYNTMKNKKNTPDKITLSKYCPFCKKHTPHSETK